MPALQAMQHVHCASCWRLSLHCCLRCAASLACCLLLMPTRAGLYHTFQNGCAGAGDAVEDTPYSAGPSEGCPVHRDTCPQPGEDPVRNFMDYSDDSCMRSFSVGQHQRVEQMWKQYRLVA